MYKVQVAYTYEWVDLSTHDTWDEAQDAAEVAIETHGEDRVRIEPNGEDEDIHG